MSVTSRLEKFIWGTNCKVTEERNKAIRDAINMIQDLEQRVRELERDEWKKWTNSNG